MSSTQKVTRGDVTMMRGREESIYKAWLINMCVNLQEQDVWDAIKHGNNIEEREDKMALVTIYLAVSEH